MGSLLEFLNEERKVKRWMLLVAGLVGGFCGATLGVMFGFFALTG